MTTTTIPQEIEQLATDLASADINVRLSTAADLVGLPRPSQVPRPGQAAGWVFDDFMDALAPLGFVAGQRTTHATIIHHKTFRTVLCGPQNVSRGSIGNPRASMACAADLRRSLVEGLEVVALVAESLIQRLRNGDLDGFAVTDDPNSIKLQLSASVTQQIVDDKIAMTKNAPSAADRAAPEELRAVFRALEREFDIGVRRAMELIGNPHAEGWALAMRSTTIEPRIGMAGTAVQLRGLLDLKRAEAKEADEEKDRQRKARTVTSAPVQETNEEKFNNAMRRAKVEILKASRLTVEEVADLLVKVKARHERIDKDIPFPAFPGVSEEMRAQVTALHDELQTIEARNKDMGAALEKIRVDYEAMRKEKEAAEALIGAAADDSVRSALRELCDLIAAKMNTTDLVQAIGAIAEVRAKAEKARGVL